MATYAIGDLQGCFSDLLRLLEHIGFNATRDRLWFVGDLVNRGPESPEVIRFVRGLGPAGVAVQGNHDLSLLLAAEGLGKRHRYDTFQDVLQAPDREELLAWLRRLPMMHVEGEYAMVHAGLLPQWSVDEALALAREVEAALQAKAEPYADLMRHLWGSHPEAWRDDLTGWERLRVIVNAMTRMRFCTPEGVMEFHHKGPPEHPPPGYLPWYAVPGRRSLTHTVLCGHWSALGFRRAEKLVALDSGCVWGGTLTAFRLEDRRGFQVPCPRPDRAGEP